MDILDGQVLYEKWFSFRETEPHNDMYELLDYGDKSFVLNSGSYFIIIVLQISYYVILYIVN